MGTIDNIIDSFIINGTEIELDSIILNGVEYLLAGSSGTRYSITWNLTNITPNPNRSSVEENKPLQVALTTVSGYEIEPESVIIMMGGVDITESVYSDGVINIPSVTNNVLVSASAYKAPIDLLNVTWANHAISCGVSTWNYQGWSPHNFQYDDVNEVFVFLQCHADDHIGANPVYINWTLSIINPYDSTDVTEIIIPTYEGLGNLVVDNGVWYLLPRGQTYAYKSVDKGVTWETLQANIPTYLFGVYKCGDTYFGGDDKNSGRKYHVSSDLLTWTEKEFDSSFGTTLCETTFCEFNDALWAFNRTNDSALGHPVILKSVDKGETWTLFSNSLLHGYRSTVSCCPFKTYIMIVDIDRDNGVLYYNKFDGETITEIQHWDVPLAGDDFHNANIATNYDDTVVIEFMHGAPIAKPAAEYSQNYIAENVMLVGSTKSLPSVTYAPIVTSEEEALSFLQTECSFTHGGAYTFTRNTYSGIVLNYDSSNGAFIDELSFPLNICCNSNYFQTVYFMDGGDFVKPQNSPLNPTVVQNFNRSTVAGFKSTAIVTIKGRKYATLYRPTKLPILTRCDDLYELTPYAVASGYNQVYGQSWQENLPFRRVFPIQESSTASTTLQIFSNTLLNGLEENPIVKVTYTQAQT